MAKLSTVALMEVDMPFGMPGVAFGFFSLPLHHLERAFRLLKVLASAFNPSVMDSQVSAPRVFFGKQSRENI